MNDTSEMRAALKPADSMQIDTLARTMWGEARGEDATGMRAVAHVVMNRVTLAQAKGGSWWGNDVVAVCRKPYQFSCWNMNDPNRMRLVEVTVQDAMFRQSLAIATRVIRGDDGKDPTRSATHYHRFDISPRWAVGVTPTIRIGAHLFYNLSKEA